MKNTAVSLDMMTMVTGKLTEIIEGDKEVQIDKEYAVNSQNSITYTSAGEVNKHSKKGIKLNSAEKSKQH
jgi:type VI secretion system secreted protein VgrG